MAISEHETTFYKLPAIDYTSEDDWDGVRKAYRIGTDYDGGESAFVERFESLMKQEGADELTAIIIGMWGTESDVTSDSVVELLVAQKERLPNLKAVFMGDITYEENEISWIQQSDMSPLLAAFPNLKVLRVRGGNGLTFSQTSHAALTTLIVETGGLSRGVIREISRCDFPKLQHLELWLGTDNYGWDGGPDDLQPILSGKLFPALERLGVCNCDGIDELVPVIVNSPLVKRLQVLDLSLGDLTDVGGRSLLELPKDGSLAELDVSHHYLRPEMVERLKKELPFRVTANDPKDPDEEWRAIYASE